MTFISWEVFFVDYKIVICIKFPKPAVEDIEMFIRKVLSNFIDIFFLSNIEEYFF